MQVSKRIANAIADAVTERRGDAATDNSESRVVETKEQVSM